MAQIIFQNNKPDFNTGHVRLATKTMQAIHDCIEIDQGAAYRQNLQKVIPHIGDAYSGDTFPFRTHMGASLIGRSCKREIWYGFRWFQVPKHSGQLLRLFNRGHLEEARFIAILLTIGAQVFQQDENGKQFRVHHAEGHFGGSGDGIIFNIPDMPNQYVLGEFKTHGEKSFTKLKNEGVARSKPEHVIQMNIYMEKMNIPAALYMAVNKNTDEIYAEIIVVNHELANQYLELGEILVYAEQPPRKLNESVGYYECKFCDFKNICHLKAIPHKNCRTCAFSLPIEEKQWVCRHTGEILSKEKQFVGCDVYSRIA